MMFNLIYTKQWNDGVVLETKEKLTSQFILTVSTR